MISVAVNGAYERMQRDSAYSYTFYFYFFFSIEVTVIDAHNYILHINTINSLKDIWFVVGKIKEIVFNLFCINILTLMLFNAEEKCIVLVKLL